MKKVAITGGIASGKTTVCQLLQELGAYTINADDIVHDLLNNDPDVKKEVFKLTAPEDPSKLTALVFKDPHKLKCLEKILHPKVFAKIDACYEQVRGDYPLFVAEVPLLYETSTASHFDTVICVTCDLETAKKRFQKPYFEERTSRQLPSHIKENQANFILENNGSLELLKQKTSELYSLLTR